MNIKVMPTKDWMAGMMEKKSSQFLAPYDTTISTRRTSSASSSMAAIKTTICKPMMIWSPRLTAPQNGRTARRSMNWLNKC